MKDFLIHLYKEERGQDLVEYALLLALVVLAATAGINTLAAAIGTLFTDMSSRVTAAT